MGTIVGGLCHNDPSGDCDRARLARHRHRANPALAAFRSTSSLPKLRLPSGRRDGVGRSSGPDDRTASSYQKLSARRLPRAAPCGVAERRRHDPQFGRSALGRWADGGARDEAERVARNRRPSCFGPRPMPRGTAVRRRPTCAGALNTRSIWLACSSREACVRRSRVWGCRHESERQRERRRVRTGRRAANAARVLPPRRVPADRHPRRLRHIELRLLRRRDGRYAGGEVVHDVRGPGRRARDRTVEGLAEGGKCTRQRASGISTACSAAIAHRACCSRPTRC